ncbi:MAG TPA: response regulator [Trueperaceae bacterium]
MVIREKAPLILLVEDNEDDVLLTVRALRSLNLLNRVEAVRDGVEAIEFMRCEGRHASRSPDDMPQLVLLDVNLPRMNGIEVLRRMKSDERTSSIPVIMLTTSGQEVDMRAAYESGANSYIRKPVESEAFQEAINNLGFYWLAVNTPPPQGSSKRSE